MFHRFRLWFTVFAIAFIAATALRGMAAEMPIDAAWQALPTYQSGQDMAALLAIDREVIRVMATPADRSACAAKLASFLESDQTTLPAKQYICLRLRQVGTDAEVPVLSRLLAKPQTSEMARFALEAMPGPSALAALHDALGTLQGDSLIGAIHSVAARKDDLAVPKLEALAADKDPKIASAALWALGAIASPEAIAFVRQRAETAGDPLDPALAVPLLRCADAAAKPGDAQQAKAIYGRLAGPGQPSGVRRAALRLEMDRSAESILSWISGEDADRRVVALGQLEKISDAELDRLAAKWTSLPCESQLGLLDVLASRKGKASLPLVMSAVGSDKPEMRLAGIRVLGQVGDESSIDALTAFLYKDEKESKAASLALCRLPREAVGKAMLDLLQERPGQPGPPLDVLEQLKYHEAMDALIALAKQEDPEVYDRALAAIGQLAQPDDADLPRLVTLLLTAGDERHRDAVGRVIFTTCRKLSNASVRVRHISDAGSAEFVTEQPGAAVDCAKPLRDALAKVDASELPKYLPLLGRFGGEDVMQMVDAALASKKPELESAAVRALCHWPDAGAADRLWTIANGGNPEHRPWALHAYVQLVTRKSDRPAEETLAMLQKAMALSKSPAERRWVLQRASNVRTMDAVVWLAAYLDDGDVNQTACESIVVLAHHRFLRQPNMNRFGPLLEKISRVSKDSNVVEQAKKYQLGL